MRNEEQKQENTDRRDAVAKAQRIKQAGGAAVHFRSLTKAALLAELDMYLGVVCGLFSAEAHAERLAETVERLEASKQRLLEKCAAQARAVDRNAKLAADAEAREARLRAAYTKMRECAEDVTRALANAQELTEVSFLSGRRFTDDESARRHQRISELQKVEK